MSTAWCEICHSADAYLGAGAVYVMPEESMTTPHGNPDCTCGTAKGICPQMGHLADEWPQLTVLARGGMLGEADLRRAAAQQQPGLYSSRRDPAIERWIERCAAVAQQVEREAIGSPIAQDAARRIKLAILALR